MRLGRAGWQVLVRIVGYYPITCLVFGFGLGKAAFHPAWVLIEWRKKAEAVTGTHHGERQDTNPAIHGLDDHNILPSRSRSDITLWEVRAPSIAGQSPLPQRSSSDVCCNGLADAVLLPRWFIRRPDFLDVN